MSDNHHRSAPSSLQQDGDAKRLTLFRLAWPILLSQFVQTLIASIDTLMLSGYSDQAVAAVGVVSQLMAAVHMLFGFIIVGSAILIAQLSGAGRGQDATRIASVALGTNVVFGMVLGLALFAFAEPVLRMFQLPPELMDEGRTYLSIIGIGAYATAFVQTSEMVLRMNGMVKRMLLLSVIMVTANTIGNYVVLYGPWGFPTLGITGVAWATHASRLLGAVVAAVLLVRGLRASLSLSGMLRQYGKDLKQIFRLGIPSAGEHLSYTASQVVVTMMIALLGTTALTAKVYTQTITGYVFLLSAAIGQATAILIGHCIGAREHDHAERMGMRYTVLMIAAATACGGALSVIAKPLLGLFTTDPEVLRIGQALIFISVLQEAGRACNVVMINALNATGEVRYPVIVGLVIMWGISIPLTYALAIGLEWGIYGVWIAFVADEWIRGIFMLARWKSGKWRRIELTAGEGNISAN
ncbi:MATE family efflux transporter [Paenibacillus turpanensis]|uniref:MATE family efflux transporter n=1 Tax=Paenibacillus turpanensis TaxID=2689078 RepID=UPI00140A0BED|nr:MATE family efflux transporter [Paenibacillus turpanensis]